MHIYEKRDAKSRTIVILSVAALALLISLGIYGVVRMVHKPEAKNDALTSGGLIFDASAVEGGWENLSQEEIEARLNAKVEEGMINISMNTAPIFADSKSEGNLMIVNEVINNYPQKVEILRNDTQEVVYASNAIPVGSKIERAALNVELEAGTYECTALFHNLDPETGSILGTAGAIITITIQN